MGRAAAGFGFCGIALAALVAANAARAAEWTFTPSISAEQAYSDNVRLSGTGSGSGEDDLSTTVTPGLRIVGDGARLDLTFDYRLSRVTFWQNSDLDEFRHSLSARGRAEILPNFLFFDAQSAVREEFLDSTSAVSGSGANATGNRATVVTYNLSPSIRRDLGTFATLRSLYRFSSTLAGSGVEDSDTHNANVGLDSGPRFRSFRWQADVTGSMRDSTTGSSSSDRLTATLAVQVPVTAKLALIGSVGYEEIEDNTLDKDPVGAIWDAGFRWTPSRRSSLSATYGRRYDDDILTVSALYAIGASTRMSASFSQSVQSSADRLSGLLLPPGTIDADGDFIDDVTGEPIDLSEGGFSFNNETTRNDTLRASLSGRLGQTTYNLVGTASQRSSDLAGTDQVVSGGTLQLTRPFGRRLSGSMSFSYRNTDFDTADGRVDDFYVGSASLTYRLQRDFIGSFSYVLTDRDSTLSTSELTENAVSLRFTKTF
jgi:uncharacterized protein (PEP-CTERM system associated)